MQSKYHNRRLVSVVSNDNPNQALTGICICKEDTQETFELLTRNRHYVLRKDNWHVVWTWRKVNPYRYLSGKERAI